MSDAPRKERSLVSLWLLIALTVAPVAASYLIYYFWQPDRTANYGELIEARPLPHLPLALADGTPFRFSQLRGKWVLVSLDSVRCDAHCDRKLVYMRQLRLTQGKNMDRVERAWIITDDAAPEARANAPDEGTWRVRAAGSGAAKLFPAQAAVTDHIYLIDPLGNLMLRFPRDPDPKSMVKDLARLLKASRIG